MAKQFKNWREESRNKTWGTNVEEGENIDREALKIGCMLRMADATEAMAKNHIQLQQDLDWYKGRYKYMSDRCDALQRSNNSLRGVITKMKKAKNTAKEAAAI